ncbi:alpha/beta hydrolase [Bacillus shivajii]|uniref:alpha/beta hydrolase n=1 Tax=Bacillus shivajii TaxID=1983719 RepID=UPI001CFA363E|nr:alpha/beta hydrolase [Bacillus shivajii]UCZ51396.1 alpha/beta hydrolase [Bacillus shivajii]
MYRQSIKFISVILSIIFLMVVTMFGLFYFFQERMLFYPQPLTEEEVNVINEQYVHIEETEIQVTNDKTIHGWFINHEPKSATPSPVLIYFGGNAEEVSHLITDTKKIDGWSIILMNYRGYGLSEGSPSEEAMFHDALAIYDHVKNKGNVDETQIAVMGRSMGTGPAVYLSSERDVTGTILVSPYDSLTNVAKDRYPFIPVSILLKHHFDNISRAPFIETPLLTLIASDDQIIQPNHSKSLVEKWSGESEKVVFDEKNHNNIQSSDNYWAEITNFLKTVEK